MSRTEGYKEEDKTRGKLQVVIGSTNQVKSRAVAEARERVFPREQILVQEADVRSGVPPQPRDDDTTKQGAMNRALHAADFAQRNYKDAAHFSVGIEDGIVDVTTTPPECPSQEIWECPAWIAVLYAKGRWGLSRTATVQLPTPPVQLLN